MDSSSSTLPITQPNNNSPKRAWNPFDEDGPDWDDFDCEPENSPRQAAEQGLQQTVASPVEPSVLASSNSIPSALLNESELETVPLLAVLATLAEQLLVYRQAGKQN